MTSLLSPLGIAAALLLPWALAAYFAYRSRCWRLRADAWFLRAMEWQSDVHRLRRLVDPHRTSYALVSELMPRVVPDPLASPMRRGGE